MIRGLHPVAQGVLGTLFTWFVTALGSAVVFVFPSSMSKEREGAWLDCCLGFSAGVMLAASYWSLLDPAIELAETNGYGVFSFVPAALGFFLGAGTVSLADMFLPNTDNVHEFLSQEDEQKSNGRKTTKGTDEAEFSISAGGLRQRKKTIAAVEQKLVGKDKSEGSGKGSKSWRR